jgi:hypothetical protein
MALTPKAGFRVDITSPDPETVLMTIQVVDGDRVRGTHTYTLKKQPGQDTDALCREACPIAFED